MCGGVHAVMPCVCVRRECVCCVVLCGAMCGMGACRVCVGVCAMSVCVCVCVWCVGGPCVCGGGVHPRILSYRIDTLLL